MKKQNLKYLFLFIGALLIMFLGSSIYAFVTYIPYKAKTNLSFIDYLNAIDVLSNYYNTSTCRIDPNYTWNEYAVIFFQDNNLFENTKLALILLQLTSYLPLCIVIFYYLKEELKEDFIKFKKDLKKSFSYVGFGFLGVYGCLIVVTILYSILKIEGDSANEQTIQLIMDSKGLIYMILATCVFAPFFEEVIFRKLVFSTCEESLNFKPVVPIILSTFIFALIHVTDVNSLKFIFAYLAISFPIVLAYYYSNRNLYVVIIIHALNNIMSVLLTLLQ